MKLYTQEEYDSCSGNTKLNFQCDYCSVNFTRTKRKERFKLNTKLCFCSSECSIKYCVQNRKTIEVVCIQCGKITIRTPSDIRENNFCSRSCAASHNNKKFPKVERKIRYCKHCKAIIDRGKTVCQACIDLKTVDWNKVTLGELRQKRLAQKNSVIRTLARKAYLDHYGHHSCLYCGYDKYIEVAHIKPIFTHSLNTTIGEINQLDNLIGLCRNCHWELDHDHLTLEEIRKKNRLKLPLKN